MCFVAPPARSPSLQNSWSGRSPDTPSQLNPRQHREKGRQKSTDEQEREA